MRRIALLLLAVTALLAGAGPARAGTDVATRLTIAPDSTTVDGAPVDLHVVLRDAQGAPVPGALLRLVMPSEFMGATKNEILDEATTNETGKATLTFSSTQTGSVEATVSFWGTHGYAPSDASVRFDVMRPVVTYTPKPNGLQVIWARSYLILIPFLAVWAMYFLSASLIVRIRRAGRAGKPSPPVTAD